MTRGQVAAFSADQKIPPRRLASALNSRLPDDVQITGAACVDERFSPISDAVAKGYRYSLAHGRRRDRRPPLFDRHITAWTAYALEVKRMSRAAAHLIGTNDFASFTRLDHGRESTVRTVYECTVTATNPRRLRIDISGDGFLYNMVRIIAGTLREVGRGRIDPDAIPAILAARDRAAAGPTMPPEGLCLIWIRYAEVEPRAMRDGP